MVHTPRTTLQVCDLPRHLGPDKYSCTVSTPWGAYALIAATTEQLFQAQQSRNYLSGTHSLLGRNGEHLYSAACPRPLAN